MLCLSQIGSGQNLIFPSRHKSFSHSNGFGFVFDSGILCLGFEWCWIGSTSK